MKATHTESFYVHIKRADGSTVLVGQCIRGSNEVKRVGMFRYAPTYLADPLSQPLDPINLPLNAETKEFPFDNESPGIPGVCLDSGPDQWGKKMLSRTRRPPPVTDVDHLLAGSGSGIGALRFTRTPHAPLPDTPYRPFESLIDVQETARLIERQDAGEEIDLVPTYKAAYFDRGASVGGARPKSMVLHEGKEWIAKFPSSNDKFDNPLAEHLTMRLGKSAGLTVAETAVVPTRLGTVLLVKRFDIENERQAHLISMHSLINLFSISHLDNEMFSYKGLNELTSKLVKDSATEEIFRRMIFNIAVSNTDDHTRNHALMKMPEDQHYELTPAYDVVPHPEKIGSHAIAVGPFGTMPTKDNVMGAAKMLGISPLKAMDIIKRVESVTANWREQFIEWGMPQKDLDQLAPAFERGLVVLRGMVCEKTADIDQHSAPSASISR